MLANVCQLPCICPYCADISLNIDDTFWNAALVSSNVGTSTGIVGATLPACPLPFAIATGIVVANAHGCANALDCTVGAMQAIGDCGQRGEPATGSDC